MLKNCRQSCEVCKGKRYVTYYVIWFLVQRVSRPPALQYAQF